MSTAIRNLVLFGVSVSCYFSLWTFGVLSEAERTPEALFYTFSVVSALCIPFNYNGNIFTVLGNAKSDKSIYSLLSFYQDAEETAFSLCSLLGYQRSVKDTVVVLGLALYQQANNDAAVFAGLAFYQRAGNDAVLIIGLALYQRAGSNSRAFGFFSDLTAGTETAK